EPSGTAIDVEDMYFRSLRIDDVGEMLIRIFTAQHPVMRLSNLPVEIAVEGWRHVAHAEDRKRRPHRHLDPMPRRRQHFQMCDAREQRTGALTEFIRHLVTSRHDRRVLSTAPF